MSEAKEWKFERPKGKVSLGYPIRYEHQIGKVVLRKNLVKTIVIDAWIDILDRRGKAPLQYKGDVQIWKRLLGVQRDWIKEPMLWQEDEDDVRERLKNRVETLVLEYEKRGYKAEWRVRL